MSKMNELATLVRELEDELVNCIRCGMCQSVCPVFEQTRREADVARGKLALLEGLAEKVFTDPDGVNERLNRCLLCGSCEANCPSGVNILQIFIKARAILTEYKGLSPLKKIIFKGMLARPELFDRVTGWAGRIQRLFIKDEKNTQGTSCARLMSPMIGHRHMLPMAQTPFRKTVPERKNESSGNDVKVLFFTGCLIDKIFPTVAHASARVLTYHGVDYTIPEGQGCCGIPALASGDRETFTKLVDHHLALFEKEEFDVLITACATCTSTIKKLWPSVYKDASEEIQEKLNAISEKTMDINQFLVDHVQPDFDFEDAKLKGDGEVVTYHDPCHLKKSLGVSAQPRIILKAAGKDLIEMDGADRCCGMGGSFNLYHYNLSSAIGGLKQKNISDTGCTTISTGCPACMVQISDMLAKEKKEIKVRHPMELYAAFLEKIT